MPGPEIYYQRHFDKRLVEYFYIFLIQGEGRTILVDSGLPKDIRPWDAWTKEAKGAEYFWRRDAMPEDVLASAGVAPADVDEVILSSLGGSATSNIHLFPKARYHLSRQGWLEHLARTTPRRVIHPGPAIVWLISEAPDRVVLVDGEAVMGAGLSVFETGCHRRSSMAIRVETRLGPVIIADCVFHYGNIEGGPELGVLENLHECVTAYERIRRESAIVIPIHDPAVLDRHPGGLIG